jgi:hypothetical protein
LPIILGYDLGAKKKMADYVGRWKCDNCGEEVWGILRHCPQCGTNTTGKYYLPENEPPTTAEEVMKIIRAGANWQCRFCQSDNYGDAPHCTECGAAREGSPTRKTRNYGLEETPTSDEEVPHDGYVEPEVEPQVRPTYTRSAAHSGTNAWSTFTSGGFDVSQLLKPALIALVVLVVGGLAFLAFRQYEVKASIDHFEWSRTIHVDQYRTVREGAWSIPAGGRYVSEEQKIHHYDRVFSHYETRTRQVSAGSESYACGMRDNGNGTFSTNYCTRPIYRTESYQEAVYRQEPRYATWYHYDIDKWTPSRHVPTANTNRDDPLPYWGELVLQCANLNRLGCERERHREEHYFVIFIWQDGEDRREYRHEEDRADWDSYDVQGEYTLVLNGFNVLVNDPLRPEEGE